MNMREMIIHFILFAFTEEELQNQFMITEAELATLADEDLLAIYDHTLIAE